MIESLHVLFTLYNEFRSNQHFARMGMGGGGVGGGMGGEGATWTVNPDVAHEEGFAVSGAAGVVHATRGADGLLKVPGGVRAEDLSGLSQRDIEHLTPGPITWGGGQGVYSGAAEQLGFNAVRINNATDT